MPFSRLSGSNHAHQGIFIAMGANQSYGALSPLENLNSALAAMENAEISVIAASRPWRTPAWPDPSDPPFVNACIQVETPIEPGELLSRLHEIEAAHGRKRTVRNAPRSLDLDIIDYRGQVFGADQEAGLTLPHPRATGRAFVLLPLRDIAPHWRDPIRQITLDRWIGKLSAADRNACRPAGGVLCAAAGGLKRTAQ